MADFGKVAVLMGGCAVALSRGSTQRGTGAPHCGDATVKSIKGAHPRSHARLRGQIPEGALFRAPMRPAWRGCDREGVHGCQTVVRRRTAHG
jgi:hypothetical protein